MTLIQIQTDLLHALPLQFPAFLEFTLLGILERGDMDFLSQLELKDMYVRCSNHRTIYISGLSVISHDLYKYVRRTFCQFLIRSAFVLPGSCPVLVHFLFGGVRSLAVNWPVLVRYLCDHGAFCPLYTPFVRASTSNGDDVHHRIIFFSNVYIR